MLRIYWVNQRTTFCLWFDLTLLERYDLKTYKWSFYSPVRRINHKPGTNSKVSCIHSENTRFIKETQIIQWKKTDNDFIFYKVWNKRYVFPGVIDRQRDRNVCLTLLLNACKKLHIIERYHRIRVQCHKIVINWLWISNFLFSKVLLSTPTE